MTNFERRRAMSRMKRIEEARQERFRRLQMLESRGQRELGKRVTNKPYNPDEDILVKKKNEREANKEELIRDINSKKLAKNIENEFKNWSLFNNLIREYRSSIKISSSIAGINFATVDNYSKTFDLYTFDDGIIVYRFVSLDDLDYLETETDEYKYGDYYIEANIKFHTFRGITERSLHKFIGSKRYIKDIKDINKSEIKEFISFPISNIKISFRNNDFEKYVFKYYNKGRNFNGRIPNTSNEFPIKKRLEAFEEFLDAAKEVANRW